MTTLQQQARALGDPTRHAIFRHIAEAGRPVGVAELTEHFAFNHNAIRQHLAKLVAAGLVIETKAAATGRGRPRLMYVPDPSTDAQWGPTGPYERLSRLLLEIINTDLSPEEVGRRASGELRVSSPSGDVVADMAAAMARQGFQPEVRALRQGAEIVLNNCPFETAARADRETVCSLHLGIAEGLAEGTAAVVDELVAYDPRRAGCRIRVRVDAGGDTDPGTGRGTGTLTLRGRPTTR